MSVEPHMSPDGTLAQPRRYDVSLKVGDVAYVVLFSPQDGSDLAKYRAGLDLPVLIGENTVTFNDLLGRQNEALILNRETMGSRTH